MARWSFEQVEAAAPDAKAMVAARKLARPGPWSDTGSTDTLLWGKCQGSGSTPYQVSVDLSGPAFKCSCPSRKFPCKHALALLLLWVEGDGAIAEVAEASGFASEWQAGRSERAERATRPKVERDEPADPAAQARRLAQRLERMDAGAAEFERWLRDLVREGLAAAKQREYAFWDGAAARLVDAQLPALGERVRQVGGDIHGRADWTDLLLAEAGRWFAAVRAWQERDRLDEVSLADLRTYLGWPQSTDEARAREVVEDTWLVLGVRRTDDGRLQAQRTWLRGEASGLVVQVLDFANVGGALRVAQVSGTRIRATVGRYPGAAPNRAVFADDPAPVGAATALPPAGSIRDALDLLASTLAANPWAERQPVLLSGTVVAEPPCLVDDVGDALPLAPDVDVWPLLARTAGHPSAMFAELEDGAVRPITLAVADELVPV